MRLYVMFEDWVTIQGQCDISDSSGGNCRYPTTFIGKCY